MQESSFKYPDTDAFNYVITELLHRNIFPKDIAAIVYDLQHEYVPEFTVDDFEKEVLDVLHKRELLNSAMVAINLDNLAQQNLLSEPLLRIVKADAGVFGVDETLATGIAQLYGSIGVTNYGYVDKTKPGIIGELDTTPDTVNTFIDDLIGAIVAAVAGKVAHKTA